MDDEEFEFNEMERLEYQEKLEHVKREHQLSGFFLLYKHWNAYGIEAAKRIYLYFKDNHNLQKMLEIFEEIEEYEKCAVIRDWLKEIKRLEKLDYTNI